MLFLLRLILLAKTGHNRISLYDYVFMALGHWHMTRNRVSLDFPCLDISVNRKMEAHERSDLNRISLYIHDIRPLAYDP